MVLIKQLSKVRHLVRELLCMGNNNRTLKKSWADSRKCNLYLLFFVICLFVLTTLIWENSSWWTLGRKRLGDMALSAVGVMSALPTLYEYYTAGGIQSGLTTDTPNFYLNGKNISIYSGTMHYFRVPRKYWRDRLRKMRAAGLNAVETYVPWNLHEPEIGKFDFGAGGTDFQDMLDIQEYLRLAKEEDLLAIVRPGPFICAEWEFGGLPSWLLREKNIKVRTSDSLFMKHVTRFFNALIPLLVSLQFTKGGPVIAVQVENEYGSTESSSFVPDKEYLRQLKNLLVSNGIVEQLVTSDSATGHKDHGTLPGEVLQTANFAADAKTEFDMLVQLQPGRPVMSMEYWSGWFDHWTESHHIRTVKSFRKELQAILDYPASVNMYMFHGGTSFGFMNGANMADNSIDNGGLQPDTTSYDYDAPISEAGDYTLKYDAVSELLESYNPIRTKLPNRPPEVPKIKYPSINITHIKRFSSLLETVPLIKNKDLIPMENLPINNNSGQSYGYIVYQIKNINIPSNATLSIKGRVCDTLMVLIDGQLVTKPLLKAKDLQGFGYWKNKDGSLKLDAPNGFNNVTLELIVENWGRNNFGFLTQFNQHKGLWQGDVSINNQKLQNWNIFPLEFKSSWTNSLQNWETVTGNIEENLGPGLYKATLTLDSDPVADTFIDMRGWVKGIVLVNGFNLGRHSTLGPQYFLYLPAPFLKKGDNEIIIFEHFTPKKQLDFSTKQLWRKRGGKSDDENNIFASILDQM